MKTVIQDQIHVSKMHIGLPPSTDHERTITLKDGVDQNECMPYSYAQVHKDGIESLIHDI